MTGYSYCALYIFFFAAAAAIPYAALPAFLCTCPDYARLYQALFQDDC